MKYSLLFILFVFVASCGDKSISDKEKSDYISKGKSFTSQVGSSLKKELTQAFKSGGLELAVPYCNARASFLTNRLANSENVKIKRISSNFRNPNNIPDKSDLPILKNFELGINSYDSLVIGEDVVDYYKAIFVEDNCLKCHGEKTQIENYGIISSLYPKDKATAYKVGDFRGLWKVSFNRFLETN